MYRCKKCGSYMKWHCEYWGAHWVCNDCGYDSIGDITYSNSTKEAEIGFTVSDRTEDN